MIYDLFAGPGGWDVGAARLGLNPLGFEWDDAACDTRRAAGLKTMQCDVAEVDFESGWQHSKPDGIIASPPCQAFSTAGKGLGRKDKPEVIACAHELAAGHDTREFRKARCEDPRSILTVEPLRWVLYFKPRWLAFEQVPAVLELWSVFAELLSAHGYETACGVLSSEQYGVPQTRKRAFLIGSLDGPVALPAPTHTKFRKGQPRQEGDLLPWVSMEDALGWGATERPSPTVTSGGTATGGAEPIARGGRVALERERERGAWVCATPEGRA